MHNMTWRIGGLLVYVIHVVYPGEVVSGYRVRDGEWEELGRVSPKKPQVSTEIYGMFFFFNLCGNKCKLGTEEHQNNRHPKRSTKMVI